MVINLAARAEEQRRREQLQIAQSRELAAFRAAEAKRLQGLSNISEVRTLQLAKFERKRVKREFQSAKSIRKKLEGKQTVLQLRRTSKEKRLAKIQAEKVKLVIQVKDKRLKEFEAKNLAIAAKLAKEKKKTLAERNLSKAREIKAKQEAVKKKAKKIPKIKLLQIKQQQQKKKLIDQIKISLPPTVLQQLNQQQTTTQEIQNLLDVKQKEDKIKGISFDLRGAEKVKRAFKGETLTETAAGLKVRDRKGKLRNLTKKELSELQTKDKISLNPLNAITGFFGVGKSIATFATSPNKKAKIAKGVTAVLSDPDAAVASIIDSAIRNPFGFIGEAVAFGVVQKVVTSPFKAVKNIKLKDRNKLDKAIKTLEDKGVKSIDRTKQGSQLRNLKEQKKIVDADLLDIDKTIRESTKPIKTNPQLKTKIKNIQDSGSKIRNRQKKRNKLKQELKDFEKIVEPKPITVKKVLPKNKDVLTKLLLQARKTSGKDFKLLKSRIKKQLNFNVVQRIVKGKVSFKLLDPKKQKKKGIPTAKPKLSEFIVKDGKITIIKRKQKVIDLKPKDKLTKKDLKDLEFKVGQNLDKVQKDIIRISKKRGFLNNKKASVNIFRTVKRHVNNTSNKIKQLKVREKQLGVTIRKFNILLKKPVTTPKQAKSLKGAKDTLSKQKTKLKQEIKSKQKDSIILRSIIAVLFKFKFKLDTMLKEVQATDNLIKSELKNINDFIIDPVKPPTKPSPKKPSKPGVKKPPVKPTKKKPPTKPSPKRPLAKPKKPKKPVKPVFKIKFKLPKKKSGSRTGYIVNIKKGNRIIKQTTVLLPRNRARNLERTILDNTLQASGEIVPKGKTPFVDVKKVILGNKFRSKRSKKTKVLSDVEKRKFRFDQKGERTKRRSKANPRKKTKKVKSKVTKTRKSSNKRSKTGKNK